MSLPWATTKSHECDWLNIFLVLSTESVRVKLSRLRPVLGVQVETDDRDEDSVRLPDHVIISRAPNCREHASTARSWREPAGAKWSSQMNSWQNSNQF